MTRFSFLFSPTARVYNLRLLLLVNIAYIGYLVSVRLYDDKYLLKGWRRQIEMEDDLHNTGFLLTPEESLHSTFLRLPFLLIGLPLILLHHTLVTFVSTWPVRGLAVLDLTMVALETGVVSYLVYCGLFYIPHLVALVVSGLFRTATIIKSKERILHQHFKFFGGCTPVHPPYTPLRILLNRSIARPLVREESRFIMLTRALILSCVVLGVPVFGVYSIILVPRTAKAYTRSVSPVSPLADEIVEWFYPTGNATILLSFLTGTASITSSNTQAYVTVEEGGGWSWQRESANFNCTVGIQNVYTFVECPQQWADVTSVTIQISVPPDGGGVWAKPIQGNLSLELKQLVQDLDSVRGAPVLAGSRLFGVINWTQRNILSQLRWGISSDPTIVLYTAEVYGLQPYPPSDVSGPNITTLTLLQMDGPVTQILQDTVDDTLLSGISAFGGFSTFVNGIFVLFFGANIVYFAFGKSRAKYIGKLF